MTRITFPYIATTTASSWRQSPVPPDGGRSGTGPQALHGTGLRVGELLDLELSAVAVADVDVGAAVTDSGSIGNLATDGWSSTRRPYLA